MATPEQTAKEAQGSKKQTQADEGKEASVIIQKPKEKTMAESAADKYRKALEAAEAIKNSAVEELKTGINRQIEELNSFGFHFRLTEESGKAPAKKTASKTREQSPICPICKFGTEPRHDGRLKFHRDQGEAKKPLTDKQLADNGLTKVA